MTLLGGGVVRESIAPGIARLIVPTATLPPATATNAWLLGSQRLTVIDPGASDPIVQEAVVEALRDDRIERVVLTHHHPDHTSGARHLSQHTGAPIFGHPDTVPLFGTLDGLLADGDTIDTDAGTWQVVHTPGHAHGHICLVRKSDGYAVMGDLLAGEGTILIAPPEGHLATYLHSLERMRSLGIVHALPAHGPVLDAQATLQLYLMHRSHRTDQVRACLQDGPATPMELAERIYPELPAPFLPIGAHQLRAHLTWLEEHAETVCLPPDRYALRAPESTP